MRKLALALVLAAGPAAATGIEITVEGEGANGVIKIDLLEDVAPLHAERITKLAQEGFYDGVFFHRVIDGFMAQTGDGVNAREGGDMRLAGTGGSELPDVQAEFSSLSFERGVVGMARAGDPACTGVPNCRERDMFLNSANSQFFITFGPVPFLDGGYTIVGRVTEGMEVVDAIKRGDPRSGRVIGRPDMMKTVSVID